MLSLMHIEIHAIESHRILIGKRTANLRLRVMYESDIERIIQN